MRRVIKIVERKEKIMPIMLFIVLIFLIFEFGYTIYNHIDYQNRVDSGNERWKQVEERIKKIEACCDGRYN